MQKVISLLVTCILIFHLAAGAQTDAGRKKVFPFELKDTLGRIVKAEDLEGKVVYMDFWFTGCKGCVQVAKALHAQVLPVFRQDTNVVFVAVSLDVNFLQWKRSIRSGLYTSPGELNVFTMGMGSDHPFFRHYGFSGAPQTMLIDKEGYVISTAPPFPGPDLISLIKEHL